jgi:hypothetical protein
MKILLADRTLSLPWNKWNLSKNGTKTIFLLVAVGRQRPKIVATNGKCQRKTVNFTFCPSPAKRIMRQTDYLLYGEEMKITIGIGPCTHFASHREQEIEIIVWWFGCAINYVDHGAQRCREVFHSASLARIFQIG